MNIQLLNAKFQKRFETAAKQMIEKGAEKYFKKYPFVSEILCGNGTCCPVDVDGISLNKFNWEMLDRICLGNENDESFVDSCYEKLHDDRMFAREDDFICFLTNLQFHPMGFCPDDIINKNIKI